MKLNHWICLALTHHLALGAFDSAEHMAIGDAVHLQFPDEKTHSLNGFSYGEIVALGGDFFAILDAPISEGIDIDDQKLRFLNAFKTLGSSPELAMRLVAKFKSTLEAIKEGEKEGKKASEVYSEIGGALMGEYNVMTGGGSFISPLFPLGTSILQLISHANWDHFVPNALIAYQAGHLAAIDAAKIAGKTKTSKKRLQGLENAYAMNAFACHYLSDSFSSGHMRTPRKELSRDVDLEVVAALLMDYMHGEDCYEGLKVKNLNGDEWIAYGDCYYFDPENAFSSSILHQIMQLSADEIYFAFQNGYDPNEGKISMQISLLLPQFDLLVPNDPNNTAPLFFWDKQEETLMRREDINCTSCYEWKSNWWGWTTLIDLAEYYRPLTSRQKALHEALYRQ